ncbi:penicillin-binding protein 2 [Sphingorhabdus lutea]|uniref:Penicillin-binding protein 2 n=1 Tax=Sphingorhabdus lutea TaxID=1913578 RepID=A0A1L3JE87_9SPHN|nr:penicillin-binding protein 2 [Sphingorhabdus lutea]
MAQQNFAFSRRTLFVGAVQGGFGVLLSARMAYIAVAENEKYRLASESNRVNLTFIPPRRGWFVDRFGKPIATNRTDFRVDVIPDRMVDKDATIKSLAELLSLDTETVERIKKEVKHSSGFQPVQVASGMSFDDFAKISVRAPDLPGVSPRQGFSRYYPSGPAVGHLIGYVGGASAEEYKALKNPLLITPGFKIGKDGLEKQFEKTLEGSPGAKRVEVTARGKIVRELTTRGDVPGKPVQLTIDIDLHNYAARRLGLESGSVVVMDCLTGDILTMASMPSFDPNSFSDGIGVSEYKWLAQDDHKPLRNKTLSGLYPPGSTVKPMVAMAFLEAGLDPEASVGCSGGLRVGNRVFRCWNRRGHGSVNMRRAISQSCDVYFYHFAQKIGMDPIALMAEKLGMGQKFDLPVASQSYGTVPNPAWMLKKHERKWAAFDTVNSTIGQGYMLANPLQLAVMASRLATGKNLMPHLLLNKKAKPPSELGFTEEHINYVRQAMSDVVNGDGTAGRARLPIADVKLAGKTGTAQVVSLDYGRGGSDVSWKYRDHGLFICFAPFDNPRYAASVVIEHGGGSGSAYPIARDVLTFLYDREAAMKTLESMEAGWGGTPEQRMARNLAAFRVQNGVDAKPKPTNEPPSANGAANATASPSPATGQSPSTGQVPPTGQVPTNDAGDE